MAIRGLWYAQEGSIIYDDEVIATNWYPAPYDLLAFRAALISQAYVIDDPVNELEIANKKYVDFAVLGITGVKDANTVFAGPASGVPASPTFRYLVDADIPDTITLTNITQITNRSHVNLIDIGSLTHATIDTYLDQAVKQASSPTFGNINTVGVITVDSVQVVGNQGAHVADATDAASVITQFNLLLTRLETHGLLASV